MQALSQDRKTERIVWVIDAFGDYRHLNGNLVRLLRYWSERVTTEILPVCLVNQLILDLFSYDRLALEATPDELASAVASWLREQDLPKLGALKVVVLDGALERDIAEAVLSYANDQKASLVALSSAGTGISQRLRFGGMAQSLSARSPIPVLFCSPQMDRIGEFDKILVPTDVSQTSRWSFELAVSLARYLGASVTLLHEMGCTACIRLVPVAIPGEFERAARKAMHAQLDNWAKWASDFEVAVRVRFTDRSRSLARSVLEFAKKTDTGLIVMGTGRGPMRAALPASPVRRILREASCPVILLQTEQKRTHWMRRAA